MAAVNPLGRASVLGLKDIRGRPWLTGVTMSSVHVTLANEEDTEEKTAENKEEKTEEKDDDPGS